MNVMDCVSTKDNMEYYENRLKTFDTYPKQMLPDKIQLDRAGLYYSGKSAVGVQEGYSGGTGWYRRKA